MSAAPEAYRRWILGWHLATGLPAHRLRALWDRLGGPEATVVAGAVRIVATGILSREKAACLVDTGGKLAEEEEKALEKRGGHWLTFLDPEYPALLLQIHDPPAVLFCLGGWDAADKAIALVGARRATPYGLVQAGRFAAGLAAAGITVVSGLARGIDQACHRGALRAGGRTVAVLGCGLDVDYPPGSGALKQAIAGQGAVVTEYPLGTDPRQYHFPQRNRILAGWAAGVLVVEAGEGSGSLITAEFALDGGREVWALPGHVGVGSNRGAHRLIKEGATLVEEPGEMLEDLGWVSSPCSRSQEPPLPVSSPGGISWEELGSREGWTPQEIMIRKTEWRRQTAGGRRLP